MKLFSTCFAAFVMLVMLACQSQSAEDETANTPIPDSVTVTPSVTSSDQAVPVVPPVNPSGQAVPVISKPTKNPAHGLPYHDCSLPVGAPLATSENPPATNFGPVQPALPSLPAGVKLNPAHGKPGHKCEIPVGAPLT